MLNDEYLRKLKHDNDQVLNEQGFQVRPAQAQAIKAQKRNLRSGSAKKSTGSGSKPRARASSGRSKSPKYSAKEYPTSLAGVGFRATGEASPFNPRDTFLNSDPEGDWAQQLQHLKEGYQQDVRGRRAQPAREPSPSQSRAERFSERPTRQVGEENFDFYRPDTADLERGVPVRDQESTKRERKPDVYPRSAAGSDLRALETQLIQVRRQLEPVVASLRNAPAVPRLGPTAELVASSVGRLMKIHSEKLLEMVLDDLVVEMIAILNHKEEMQRRLEMEGDLKAMAFALCEELNKIDIDQRVLLNGPRSVMETYGGERQPLDKFGGQGDTFGGGGVRGPLLTQSLNSPALLRPDLSGPYDALTLIHGAKDASGLPRDFQRDLQFSIYNKVSGPLAYTPSPATLALPLDLIVSVAANKCLNEVSVEAVKYLRKTNVQAYQKAIDQVIDGVFEQVCKEFEEAQEEFVEEVVKGEFPSVH